jgi:hypothetical protein
LLSLAQWRDPLSQFHARIISRLEAVWIRGKKMVALGDLKPGHGE